jgi:hypothetical protein
MGMADYKSDKISNMLKSPYISVQKSELHAIFMVLLDYPKSLNIITDSLYAKRVILYIQIAEFVPDNSELTLLFIQLQMDIRSRNHPLYITHIPSHTGLLGPLVQGHDETDQLLIGNVLLIMHFMKKNIILIGEV